MGQRRSGNGPEKVWEWAREGLGMGQRRFGNEATYCWFISHLLISTLLPIRLVKAKLQHRRVKVFQHSVVVQAVHSADQPLPSLLPRPSWKEGKGLVF